jgi:hypothetical protein
MARGSSSTGILKNVMHEMMRNLVSCVECTFLVESALTHTEYQHTHAHICVYTHMEHPDLMEPLSATRTLQSACSMPLVQNTLIYDMNHVSVTWILMIHFTPS